jgi:predicted PurR-regulated permease PerM
MIVERRETSGAHFFQVAAAVVIVVGGLKLGQPVLLPFALALFLAVMSLPMIFWLQMRQVPVAISILITVLLTVGVFGLIVLLASQSVAELQPQLPRYSASLSRLFDSWLERGGAFFQVDLREYVTPDLFDPGRVFDFLGATATRIAGFLSSAFVVFLILAFMLGEATVFPFKVRAILGRRAGDGRRMTKIIREVQEYLVIKTLVSLTTGLLIGLWAWILGLDFPVLLGLGGFVLNYIPTVGSILAAIPALLLSLVLVGTWTHAALVALGYLVINTIFGNIIEPQLMGRRLGLSTLVVILSLLFWAWLWGPVGALLSVPLTMAVKIMLENTEDLRWAAVLLDKSPPQARIYGAVGESHPEVVDELPAEGDPVEPPGDPTSEVA